MPSSSDLHLHRRGLLIGGAAVALVPGRVRAQTGRPLRIGVMNDQSGPYRDGGGLTSVACVRQAAAEFGNGAFPIEVLTADHQNKADIAAGIARQWMDRDGIDVVMDVPFSAAALAVNSIVREKNKVYINCGAVTTELTGGQCTPNTVHWMFTTTMLSSVNGTAIVKAGGNRWFLILADYVFGQEMRRTLTQFVEQAGGQVTGSVAYPFPGTTDFSSFLLQAQASGANVVALINSGSDTINSIKQAHEFGLEKAARLAATLLQITDVAGIGLDAAQGLSLTETFYWDLNDRTRAFAKRVMAGQNLKAVPNSSQSSNYGAALHCLKAVAQVGVQRAQADGAAVVAAMKAMPADDDAFGPTTIRADGRQIGPAYLFEVKAPAESRSPWDLYKLMATVPGEQAYGPISQACLARLK